MIVESGPSRIIEVDKDGKVQREIKLKVNHPNSHSDTRLARKISNGHYLVAHESDGAVREYDASGKIIWAKHNEVQQANLKSLTEQESIKDGERLQLTVKDMGTCDIYPQTISHNPNGRFVVVCGDGDAFLRMGGWDSLRWLGLSGCFSTT